MASDFNRDGVGLRVLSAQANIGYGNRPIPDARDCQIAQVVENLAQKPVGDRSRAGLKPDNWMALTAFAERMAALAVRQQDARYIQLAQTKLRTPNTPTVESRP